MLDKLTSWKFSQTQVSTSETSQAEENEDHEVPPDAININNAALNPKVISFKSLCLLVFFSVVYFLLHHFFGATNWYRSFFRSDLNRLLFIVSVQSLIYLQNHKLRRFVHEEMIQPIIVNSF